MANLNDFLAIVRKKMEEKGLVEFPNPEDLAEEMVGFCEAKMDTSINDDDIDNMPIFSSDGDIVSPAEVDDLYETLDVCDGKCK